MTLEKQRDNNMPPSLPQLLQVQQTHTMVLPPIPENANHLIVRLFPVYSSLMTHLCNIAGIEMTAVSVPIYVRQCVRVAFRARTNTSICLLTLTFITLWDNSADDKLVIFFLFFSRKN